MVGLRTGLQPCQDSRGGSHLKQFHVQKHPAFYEILINSFIKHSSCLAGGMDYAATLVPDCKQLAPCIT